MDLASQNMSAPSPRFYSGKAAIRDRWHEFDFGPRPRESLNSAFYGVFALALAVAATVFRLRTFVVKP